MLGTFATITQALWPAPALPTRREPFLVATPRVRLTGWLTFPAQAPKGLVVVAHGLGGDAEGAQVRRLAARLLPAGFAVLAWNGRGVLGSEGLDGGTHHAGRADDLEVVIAAARARYPELPLGAVGISLGGHIVLRHALLFPAVFPRLAVCAPLNLAEAAVRTDRHPFFRRYYAWSLSRNNGGRVRGIIEFDNRIVAPANGFRDAFDYYRRMGVYPYRHDLPAHVYCLVGRNDPVIPSEQYKDVRQVTWASGGHLGQGFPGPPKWPAWVVATLKRQFPQPGFTE